MSNIDHVQEALNRINGDFFVDEFTELRFVKAQVHATLAEEAAPVRTVESGPTFLAAFMDGGDDD